MWQVRIQTIKFADNREATGLWVTPNTPAQAIIDALQIPHPRAVLLLNGGTAGMEASVHSRLASMLQDGLARVVSEEQITVITGGTEAGIFICLDRVSLNGGAARRVLASLSQGL